MPNQGDKKVMSLRISNEDLGYTATGSGSFALLLEKNLRLN